MKEKDVIYNARVTRLDNFEVEKYSGAHEGPMKSRIYGHRFCDVECKLHN